MPVYVYKCEDCGYEAYVTMSLEKAAQDPWIGCLYCISSSCHRVPQSVFVQEEKKKEPPKKVGDITEEFIKEARQELEEHKKDVRNREYKKC